MFTADKNFDVSVVSGTDTALFGIGVVILVASLIVENVLLVVQKPIDFFFILRHEEHPLFLPVCEKSLFALFVQFSVVKENGREIAPFLFEPRLVLVDSDERFLDVLTQPIVNVKLIHMVTDAFLHIIT